MMMTFVLSVVLIIWNQFSDRWKWPIITGDCDNSIPQTFHLSADDVDQMQSYVLAMDDVCSKQSAPNTELWGSAKKQQKVVNFGSLSLRSFLQKIRITLLNAVLTPQESLKNFVLKKIKKKGVKKAKNMLLMFVKVKLGVKKIVLVNAEIFAFNTILTNMSKQQKKGD